MQPAFAGRMAVQHTLVARVRTRREPGLAAHRHWLPVPVARLSRLDLRQGRARLGVVAGPRRDRLDLARADPVRVRSRYRPAAVRQAGVAPRRRASRAPGHKLDRDLPAARNRRLRRAGAALVLGRSQQPVRHAGAGTGRRRGRAHGVLGSGKRGDALLFGIAALRRRDLRAGIGLSHPAQPAGMGSPVDAPERRLADPAHRPARRDHFADRAVGARAIRDPSHAAGAAGHRSAGRARQHPDRRIHRLLGGDPGRKRSGDDGRTERGARADHRRPHQSRRRNSPLVARLRTALWLECQRSGRARQIRAAALAMPPHRDRPERASRRRAGIARDLPRRPRDLGSRTYATSRKPGKAPGDRAPRRRRDAERRRCRGAEGERGAAGGRGIGARARHLRMGCPDRQARMVAGHRAAARPDRRRDHRFRAMACPGRARGRAARSRHHRPHRPRSCRQIQLPLSLPATARRDSRSGGLGPRLL